MHHLVLHHLEVIVLINNVMFEIESYSNWLFIWLASYCSAHIHEKKNERLFPPENLFQTSFISLSTMMVQLPPGKSQAYDSNLKILLSPTILQLVVVQLHFPVHGTTLSSLCCLCSICGERPIVVKDG